MQEQRTCLIEDCERPAMARGWCQKHYDRWRKTGDPLKVRRPWEDKKTATCTVEGCSRPYEGNGYCHPHNWRFKRYGDPQADKPIRGWRQQGCAVEGCDRPHSSRGWCEMHYQRWRIHGDPLTQRRAENGKADFYDSNGYHNINVGGRIVKEHRYVIEQQLGRPLCPGENVHHKNGLRWDNRPENLELWVELGQQPKGSRAADLLAWAEEIVARYGPERDLL